MQIIVSDKMPISSGHYSMCVEHNGTLYLAGQLPVDPETKMIPEGIEAQTKLVLNNIKTIVEAAGSSLDKVIHVRIYVSDIALWNQVNAIYTLFFKDHKPARAVIPTGPLHYGCLIEAEAIVAK